MYYIIINVSGNDRCVYAATAYPTQNPLVVQCSASIFIPPDIQFAGSVSILCGDVPASTPISAKVFASQSAFQSIASGNFLNQPI